MPSSDDEAGDSRKRVVIGVLSACLLAAMVIGTVVFFVTQKADEEERRAMRKTTRSVEIFCAPTDFQGTCRQTLKRALSKSADPAGHPQAAAAAAIGAAGSALTTGFNRSTMLDAVRQSNETLVWEAVRDCRMLMDDCRADLGRSLASVDGRGVDGPAQDLQTWLSAVITFQGSCIDMFPKGEVREQVRDEMEKAREVSSNAIAIIHQGAALAAMLDLDSDFKDDGGIGSRLLREDEDEEDRRRLAGGGKAPKGSAAAAAAAALTPNVTVAKDGSGDFKNISAALDAMPEKYAGRYFIYVKEGVYEESVNVSNAKANITMYGDGAKRSIITGNKNVVDGVRMWRTATFCVDADSFTGIRLGIRNTAGAGKQQAIALRVKGDKAVFFNCRMEGHQNTLFAQAYRQFYRSCVISGTVDFIFGDAAAVFQRCVLLVRPPLPGQPAVITAQSRRDHQQTTGFVIHRSQVVADERRLAGNRTKTYLGRPWKDFARMVVMETAIGGFVDAEGYMPWEGKEKLGTAFFGEFGNTGAGANVTGRQDKQGFHVMAKEKALEFTVGRFLHGADWIPPTSTPVSLGLYNTLTQEEDG